MTPLFPIKPSYSDAAELISSLFEDIWPMSTSTICWFDPVVLVVPPGIYLGSS